MRSRPGSISRRLSNGAGVRSNTGSTSPQQAIDGTWWAFSSWEATAGALHRFVHGGIERKAGYRYRKFVTIYGTQIFTFSSRTVDQGRRAE